MITGLDAMLALRASAQWRSSSGVSPMPADLIQHLREVGMDRDADSLEWATRRSGPEAYMNATSMDGIVRLLWGGPDVGLLPSGGVLGSRAASMVHQQGAPLPRLGYLQPREQHTHWTLRQHTGGCVGPGEWNPMDAGQTLDSASTNDSEQELLQAVQQQVSCGCPVAAQMSLHMAGYSQTDLVNCGPHVVATLVWLLHGAAAPCTDGFTEVTRGAVISLCVQAMYGSLVPFPSLSFTTIPGNLCPQ